MTDEMMNLRALLEKSSDADLLRDMIGFTAQRLMELEVEGLTGAAHGERSPERMTHLYGPAARCKPKMMIWRRLVLRFCIRPIDGAFELLAIMDIRARSISFASRPRRPDGSPDHERAGETFLHLLFSNSQTWAGKPTIAFGD